MYVDSVKLYINFWGQNGNKLRKESTGWAYYNSYQGLPEKKLQLAARSLQAVFDNDLI